MRKLLPDFIYNKYIDNEAHGKIQSLTLFMDISGFTSMTERLMKEGKEGAEVLTTILNGIFEPVIESVYNRGGFVASFAGDAFTAVFPGTENPYRVIYSAIEINRIFKGKEIQKSRFGEFKFYVKLGLSCGNVDWGIVGTEKHKAFYFKGEAIDGCAESEHHSLKSEIIADSKLIALLGNKINAYQKKSGYFLINPSIDILRAETLTSKTIQKEEIASQFYPDYVLKSSQEGDFRDVASVFVSIKDIPDYNTIKNLSEILIQETDRYGGYFEGFDFGDKGSKCLIFFGAPISHENNILRAVKFCDAIREKYKDSLRIGVTYGNVFAGYKGSSRRCSYGLQGNTINLSSRLAMKGTFGRALVSEPVYNRIREEFNAKSLGEITFKGISHPIAVYEIFKSKTRKEKKMYITDVIGREKETEQLKLFIKPVLEGKNGGVSYIYGEAGIGKSRLAYELYAMYRENVQMLMLQTDSILKKGLNPFRYGLGSIFKQNDLLSTESKKDVFDRSFGELIRNLEKISDPRKEDIIKELKSTKSFIASLFDIRWQNSPYEQVSARLRHENVLFAIKNVIKAISLIKPLFIILEDLQWADNQSKDEFQILMRNVKDYPFCIIATSRFYDDGSKPKLEMDSKVPVDEVVIGYLQNDTITELVNKQMGGETNEDLVRYIKEKTQGNPFYIEQFCLYLKQNGLITERNGYIGLTEDKMEIPSNVNNLLLSRIDRLPSEIKETAKVASILGREFNVGILGKITTQNNMNDLSKNIKQIISLGVDKNIWDIKSKVRYIFNHALLHEAIYEMQPKKRLRQLHKIAGMVMEMEYKQDKELYIDIANQYEKAESIDKAKEYYLEAAKYYIDLYKNDDAIRVCNKLLSFNLSTMNRLFVLKLLLSVYDVIGEIKKPIALCKEGIELSKKVNNESYLIWFIKMLGWVEKNNGDLENSELHFIESMNKSEKANDRTQYAESIGNLGIIYSNKGNFKKSMEYFKKSNRIAKEINDTDTITKTLSNMGIIYAQSGDIESAEKIFLENMEIDKNNGNKHSLCLVYGNLGLVYNYKGEMEKSLYYYNKQMKLAEEISDRKGMSRCAGNMGILYHQIGDIEKAIKYYNIAKQISYEINHLYNYLNCIGNLGLAFQDKGDFDKAFEYYDKQKDISIKYGYKNNLILYYSNQGTLYYLKGDYEKALEYYKKQGELCKELGNKLELFISKGNTAKVYYDLGRKKEAEEIFREVLKLVGQANNKYYIVLYSYELALLLFDTGRIQEAEELNNESYNIACDMNLSRIILDIKILKYKIDSIKDKNSAINSLIEIMTDDATNLSEEQKANINYELWILTKKDKYKDKSLELYKEMFRKTPKIVYKNRVDELESA